jgi:hypothetical protein
MFYHKEINTVMYQWPNKYINKDEALKTLGEIEDRAYKRIPNAEPDGDITYAVAIAIEEILGV